MKTLKLGKKKFRIKSPDVIFRYEITTAGYLVNPVFSLLFSFSLAMLPVRFPLPLLDFPAFMPLYVTFLLGLSACIGYGTRLFKRTVVVNRREQRITSSFPFAIGTRSVTYSSLVPRRVTFRAHFRDVVQAYLSEEVTKKGSSRVWYRNYMQFNPWDHRFLADLRDYMNYRYSEESSRELRVQLEARFHKEAEKRRAQQKIRKGKMKKAPSFRETLALAKAYHTLALINVRDGKLWKAVSQLENALIQVRKVKEKNPSYYRELLSTAGACYFRQDDFGKALNKFRQAHDAGGDPDDLHALAVCQIIQGKYDDATENLRILYDETELPEHLILLTDLYLATDRKGMAVEVVTAVLNKEREGHTDAFQKIKAYSATLEGPVIDLSGIIERESKSLMKIFPDERDMHEI